MDYYTGCLQNGLSSLASPNESVTEREERHSTVVGRVLDHTRWTTAAAHQLHSAEASVRRKASSAITERATTTISRRQ